MQFASTPEKIAFRAILESVRKDIECFFGILKGRFRILKMQLLYRGIYKLDNIFHTCCALHNMLHSYDGLSLLEKDVDWAGADGDVDPWVEPPPEIPPRTGDHSALLSPFCDEFEELQTNLAINYAEMNKKKTFG